MRFLLEEIYEKIHACYSFKIVNIRYLYYYKQNLYSEDIGNYYTFTRIITIENFVSNILLEVDHCCASIKIL